MSSTKKRKRPAPRRTVPVEPASWAPRLETLTGYRKPQGEYTTGCSESPIFNEEEVDLGGEPVRLPVEDPNLARSGVSHLDKLAHQCGERVSTLIKTDIGRARRTLEAHGHEPHQYQPAVKKDCPVACHDAGDLLEAAHTIAGIGMSTAPLLPERHRQSFWTCIELAYTAGRLGARLEARPVESYTDTGRKVHAPGGRLQEEREARDAETPLPPPGVALARHYADRKGDRDRVTEDRARRSLDTLPDRKCEICGDPFPPKTNRAKRCHLCVNLSRKRAAARSRKRGK